MTPLELLQADRRRVVVTHRAHHDRQMWRYHVNRAFRWIARFFDRRADRIDPWHPDCPWYTAPDHSIHLRFRHSWTADGPIKTEYFT